MSSTDFPFGYNLPDPTHQTLMELDRLDRNLPAFDAFRNYTADDVFYGPGLPITVLAAQKLQNEIMDAHLNLLRMPWFKVKEELCPPTPTK